MWIYSLGVTVRAIIKWNEVSIGLRTILSRMLAPDLRARASLMDLLDVSEFTIYLEFNILYKYKSNSSVL
ncbi:hypothetical protein O3M35_009482 [Rhynocoris fuscipes]|uniref:Uncharacterized protein n=1 Tax=Rhynocoris fuscipes TaxID=488301 RepID=A0AAW1D5S8_9HEMI